MDMKNWENAGYKHETQSLQAGLPHVAFVLLWFPLFTQPFIFREVECLRKILPIEIYTLYGKNLRHCSGEMRNYDGIVHRFGMRSLFFVCWKTLLSLILKPALTWRLFKESCLRHWPSLEVFGENLWGFCVGVSLAQIFREQGIDLVYSPWPRGAATAARVGAILANLPYAIAARGDNLEPADPDLADKFSGALFIRANNAADRKRIENFANGIARGKTELLYNSLTLSGPDGDAEDMKHEGRTIRLFALGRFDVTKGFDVLLNACAILKEKGMNFHLTLAGGGGKVMGLGNLEESLRNLRKKLNLEECVSMPGLISHDELPGFLKESDIFVAPCVIHSSGRRDGIPNTVIEALASGVPVVSTNVNALPEVIQNGRTGLTVQPGNPEELAEAIIYLAENPEKAKRYAQAGAILAKDLFGCENNAKKMAEIFRSRYENWKKIFREC